MLGIACAQITDIFAVVAVSRTMPAAAVAVVPVSVVAAAVAPHQFLQSVQIGVVFLTGACQVELVLAVSQWGLMMQMQLRLYCVRLCKKGMRPLHW